MNVFEKLNFVLDGHLFIDKVIGEPKFRCQIHQSYKALLGKLALKSVGSAWEFLHLIRAVRAHDSHASL